jgi:integrase/recombinase XerD
MADKEHNPMKISKVLDAFVLDYRLQYSAGTAEYYRQDLTYLIQWLNDPEIVNITTTDLSRFMVHLQTDYCSRRVNEKPGHPIAPSTVDNYWKSIRAFFRWAENNIDAPRPDLKLHRPKFRTPEIIPFTQDELIKIIDACEFTQDSKPSERCKSYRMRRPTSKRDIAIVMTLLDTGVRLGELCRIKHRDLSFETGEIVITPFGTGKKTRPRVVPIGEDTKRAIMRWITSNGKDYEDDDLVFPPAQNVKNVIRYFGERLGIDCHPHKFRHTMAIEYLKNGGDVYTLKRILGHASLTMTERYLHIISADVKSAHIKASPVDKLHIGKRIFRKVSQGM